MANSPSKSNRQRPYPANSVMTYKKHDSNQTSNLWSPASDRLSGAPSAPSRAKHSPFPSDFQRRPPLHAHACGILCTRGAPKHIPILSLVTKLLSIICKIIAVTCTVSCTWKTQWWKWCEALSSILLLAGPSGLRRPSEHENALKPKMT